MNNDEVLRVQTYLRLKFSNDMLTLKRGAKDDMVEVFMEDEFIGTLFRDDEAKYLMLSTWPFWNLTCQQYDWDAA